MSSAGRKIALPMDRITIKYIFFGVLFLVLSASCAERDSYDAKLKLEDYENHEEFVNNLKDSGLDYRVGKNGYLHFHSRDLDDILKVAFTAGEPSYPVSDKTRSWTVTQEQAKNIILKKYPNILVDAYMTGPVASKVQNAIKGFSVAGENVWYVYIGCNKGAARAMFFVHTKSGKIYVIQKPDEDGALNCRK